MSGALSRGSIESGGDHAPKPWESLRGFHGRHGEGYMAG